MSYTPRYQTATQPSMAPAMPATQTQAPTQTAFGQTVPQIAPNTAGNQPYPASYRPGAMIAASGQAGAGTPASIGAAQPAITPAMESVSPTPRASKSDYRDVAYILTLAGLKPSRLWIKPAESTVRVYWDPAQLAALGIDPRTMMVAVCRHAATTLCGNPEAGYVYAGQSSAKPFLPYGGVEVVIDLEGVRQLAATIRASHANRQGGNPTVHQGQKAIGATGRSGRANRQAIMAAQAAAYLR